MKRVRQTTRLRQRLIDDIMSPLWLKQKIPSPKVLAR
jgi:hypothetical protein